MALIRLQNLLGKRKDAEAMVSNLLNTIDAPISIEDAEGRLLLGQIRQESAAKYPIQLEGETLGWVSGGKPAEAVADLLSHLAAKEAEKKTLGSEVLHLYREVNLIYNFSEKLAALLDLEAVARMALEQASQMIAATGGAVMLINEAGQTLESTAGFGISEPAPGGIKVGEGIIGAIAASGNAEIVNEVQSDPRHAANDRRISSLICAPLKVKERVTGVILLTNTAATVYSAADLKLLNTLAVQTATAIENALLFKKTIQAAKDREQLLSLHKELEVASAIQKSIVPGKFPPFPDRKEFEIFAAMIPAKEVGGDFYDFFLIDKHRVGFVIGDVSGKGVPAALLMSVSKTLIKAHALRGIRPDTCLETVNNILVEESPSHMFVTALYGVLDSRNGTVEFCSGGHNPPCLVSNNGSAELVESRHGLVLGAIRNSEYQSKMMTLQPGDSLFLYTDGVTEAKDINEEEFQEVRMLDCLKKSGRVSLNAAIQKVIDEVQLFANGAPQADDITCLAVRYLG